MMRVITIQKMQLVWVGLGLTYNGMSALRVYSGSDSLSPTDPLAGSAFVIACGLMIIIGMLGARRMYQISVLSFGICLAYSGVWLHVFSFMCDSNLMGYSSFASWVMALLINVYGATTLLMGSWFAREVQ